MRSFPPRWNVLFNTDKIKTISEQLDTSDHSALRAELAELSHDVWSSITGICHLHMFLCIPVNFSLTMEERDTVLFHRGGHRNSYMVMMESPY